MSGKTGSIRIQNPNVDQDNFRKNSQSALNVVGKANFGKGISGRMGLLKGSGVPEIAYFVFDKEKWTEEEAQSWVENSNFEFENTCSSCVEVFESGEIWIKGIAGHMNEEFGDGRKIVGLDIPENFDIPIRDKHTENFGKILGLTNKDHITIKDNKILFKWKVTNSDIKELVRSAKNPKGIFKYSVELSNPIRVGNKRAGLLSGIAATDKPADKGAQTTEVLFETLTGDEKELFESEIEKKNDSSQRENVEDNNMTGDKETMELRLEIKDLETARDKAVEKFEEERTARKNDKEAFESEISDLKEKFETVEKERDDFKEKFEQEQKDHKSTKDDKAMLLEKVEKFEEDIKNKEIAEIFELGIKAEIYSKEKEADIKKELFELSTEVLNEKKNMLGIMVAKTSKNPQAKDIGGRGQENFEGQEKTTAKGAFNGLF
jgi:hypothetical protein